jgi:hypothetical protein
MKSYHFAMVEDKKGPGLGTLLKVAAVGTAVYYAYKQLKTDPAAEGGTDLTQTAKSTIDKAATEAKDFAARVAEAAKKAVK